MCRWEPIGKMSKVSFSRITFKEINFEIMLRIDLGLGTEASDKLLCFLCLVTWLSSYAYGDVFVNCTIEICWILSEMTNLWSFVTVEIKLPKSCKGLM